MPITCTAVTTAIARSSLRMIASRTMCTKRMIATAIVIASAATTPAGAQRPVAMSRSTAASLSRLIPNYRPIALSRADALTRLARIPGGTALELHTIGASNSSSASGTNVASVSTSTGPWIANANGLMLDMEFYGAFIVNDVPGQSTPIVLVGDAPQSFVFFGTAPNSGTHPQLYVLTIDVASAAPDAAELQRELQFSASGQRPYIGESTRPTGAQQVVSACEMTGAGQALSPTVFRCTVAAPAASTAGIVMVPSFPVQVLGGSLTWM